MAMRLSGLMSGMDTDSIIQELVSARRTKVDTQKKAQTKLEWKQDAWKDLNKKLKNLQSKYISNMRFQSSFAKKTTKISNTNAASVFTEDGAPIGTQTLRITSLAKSGYLTGGVVEAKDAEGKAINPTALTKMKDLGFAGEGSFDVTMGNGSTTSIKVTEDSSISDVLTQLKDAGLNASFDANNKRLFISSKTTGSAADFTISASTVDGQDTLAKLGLQTAEYYQNMSQNIADYETDIQSAVQKKVQGYAARHNELTGKLDRLDELTQKYTDVTDIDEKLKELNEQLEQAAEGEDTTDIKTTIEELKQLKDLQTNEAKIQDELTSIEEMVTVSTGPDGLVAYAASDKLKDLVTASYQARIDQAKDRVGNDLITATKIDGSDAEIYLNNARFTSKDNTFKINGLTITTQELTGDKEVTLSTERDTNGIYDMIKNFLKEYNSIINEMDKLYNADSAKGFEPLTDEEKEAMSETEAKKYEDKIKDSLLRRDENLNTVSSALKGIMSGGIEVNGKMMYLQDFGIDNLGYFNAADNEKNAFHIDGDEDDDATSGKENKLKRLISSDPDTVISFFSGLSQSLYEKMDKLSSSVTGYRTFGNFYDDKKMASDYKDYTSRIAELEEKLNDYEDQWYKKFSKMETAMAKMQSNMSAITGLIGGGQ